MSAEREDWGWSFYCEDCGEEFGADSPDDSFEDVWDAAKRSGWSCFRDDDGDWQHYCRTCSSVSDDPSEW